VEEQPRLVSVHSAADEAATRGWQAVGALVGVLADVDLVGDDGLAGEALRVLGQRPALVARIDEYARRVLWYSTGSSRLLGRLAVGLDRGSPGPIVVALASTHRDGRIRERAVTVLLDRPSPELMPFLALRTGDWVTPVRDRARAGLALLLADDPGTYLPAALPTIVLMEARLRGGFAYGQALAALVTAPARVREAMAGSGGRRQRRFVFDVALAHGRLGLDDLVVVAERDDDVRIRVRAAEAACREAVWTRRVPILLRLAGNRRAEVRVVALTGLVRIGETSTVVARLDDVAPLVRALARDTALRLGTDALGYYRAAVSAAVPATGAIAGLAETGTAADAAPLRPLLAHPTGAVRAAAVRALHLMDAVDVDETVPLLHDPSPAVVREATTALRPFPRRVPPDLAWQLLAHQRVELRRAGYRLLRDRSAAVQLRAALILAVDPDPDLARRGRADVTRLARAAAPSSRPRTTPPDLRVTAAEHTGLTELAHRAAPALGDETAALLTDWLATARPEIP
jgi:HEAT repeat protein